MADGLITVVLGLLVFAEWPASGLWVIGLFVGIDLDFLRRCLDRAGAWHAYDVKDARKPSRMASEANIVTNKTRRRMS